jgi:hypothetical protein
LSLSGRSQESGYLSMKKIQLIACMTMILILSAASSFALDVGNGRIQKGDTTWEVRTVLTDNGGKVIGKEIGGADRSSGYYSSDGGRDYVANSKPVERWIVSVPKADGGISCYELTFIGLILEKIGPRTECK